MEKPEGYPEVVSEDHQGASYAGSSSNWFSDAKDDMSLLESGLLGKYYGSYDQTLDEDYNYYYSFESKLGKLSDPRLLAVVEFFRELYFRRRELFRKIFPQLQAHFLVVLKKSGTKLWRVKSGSNQTRFASMQRSLSLGSPGSPGIRGVEPPLRNEWIKVKTINVGGGVGGSSSGGQGGSETKSGGSK
ncbi:hypothetical protein PanWU01x14_181590 [Parasponia andersonii]|uniref:Uncharacterized protein n=1 Tax=Parasponia andersonii TaxID=3476 RepID=A0A2P5C5N3_PARAD|nr:hypothetical protein PanWU01x14_181580 [Parasponia andersonii]PON56328.1 hypothetical protein PanWU01x14_181590 [Parasponia andersonii]